MQFSDILARERVTVSLAGNDKDGVLRALAQMFGELDADYVYQVLADREVMASTGVGHEVAIPHGRIPGLRRPLAALGIHPIGVSFDSVDGAPVKIFVAVLSPAEHPGEQLKVLARVSRLLREEQVRNALVEAKSTDQVLGILAGQ